ncbi:MAG: CHAT domain-containing protein [Anaerolineae bacterium]
MQAGPWHVFHFVGHAAFDPRSAEGVLLLAGDDGQTAPVSASQLAGLLADHHTLRLAVLNACEGAKGSEQSRFSSLAAGLVRRGLPAVLAMQYAISDRAAIEFTSSFYGALAAGLPIDAATSEARKAIDLALAGSLEWGTPVLIMRTPDGALWNVQTAAQAAGAGHGSASPRPRCWWSACWSGLLSKSAQPPARRRP